MLFTLLLFRHSLLYLQFKPLSKMKILLSFSLLLLTYLSHSQSITVEAVINPGDVPDGLGKAVIFKKSDSSLVKGNYLDSIFFTTQFNGKIGEEYYMKIIVPSRVDTTINFTVKSEFVQLGTIEQKMDLTLDEVKVTYIQPMFERTMNGISVNVDGTTLAQLNTLFDVLKASPRLTSPDEESIEIIGKGSPLILVDRQPIITNDELKAIPADQVDRIEIITNPSAKYKAQGSGGGVIEVYTKDFSLEGYQASIRAIGGITTQLMPTEAANIGLSFKKKKFSLNSYFGINHRMYNSIGESYGTSTSGTPRSYKAVSDNVSSNLWYYFNLKSAYRFNEFQRLTFGVNGNGSEHSSEGNHDYDYLLNDSLITVKDRSSNYKSQWRNNSAFANYTWETDTLGSAFEVNFNFFRKVDVNTNESLSRIDDYELGTSTRFDIKTEARNQPNVGELRANYEHYFDTSGWVASFGGEYSLLKNGKRFGQSSLIDNSWIVDDVYTNSYDYQEDNAGMFAEVSKNWDKVGIRFGLRGEYTKLYGYSQSLQQTFMDSNYVALFPSGSILLEPSENIGITFYYDSGIDRPSFSNYDPFVRVIDSLEIHYGNPYLRPSFEHSAGVEFDLFYAYNISLNYYRLNDPISDLKFIRDNSFLSESTPANADYEESWDVSLSIPIQLPWLRGWNSAWVSYDKYVFTEEFQRDPFINVTYGVYSYLTFELPKKFSIQNRFSLSRWGGDNMIARMNYNWAIRATKKFDKNSLQCFAEVANIAPRQSQHTITNGNYTSFSSSQYSFTTFKIGMFVKFGRLKAPDSIQDSSSGQSGRM